MIEWMVFNLVDRSFELSGEQKKMYCKREKTRKKKLAQKKGDWSKNNHYLIAWDGFETVF